MKEIPDRRRQQVLDILFLVTRVVLGIVFIAHGRLKAKDISGTIDGFRASDIPLPTLSCWFTLIVEFGGGAAMILGLALPLTGLLQAVITLGALVYVHREQGFYTHQGGYEFVLVLAAVSLTIGATGGRFAADELIAARSRTWARLTGRPHASASRESVSV
ncbi:DoxX family protein [Streptomyces sp. SID3343]|uniref:DoxX family protein n=1 Tax=Streptomyces sp. SID3343 TaxID=2690260 RepID=UPI001369706D|nr:DoxX family protein [Streptomyces sp. SID3343]MYW04937.1 DoxX family membrane protein [Streptomyces sp. SID3343]